MTNEERIQWLFKAFPETRESNTELYAKLIEVAYHSRSGEELPQLVKDLLREFKPEAVVRKRRQLKKGTAEQYAQEQEYRKEYTTKGTNYTINQ